MPDCGQNRFCRWRCEAAGVQASKEPLVHKLSHTQVRIPNPNITTEVWQCKNLGIAG